MNGNATTAVKIAPSIINVHASKSNNVFGRRSSLEPTSAEKRFKIRPEGLVSK
eukprot:CAMPEP_0198273804 /NCGR_PEP_ID=MMETSP1447-20131203/58078_1 /TAXON_ID=420782 /ORGANISM="Chaetoceros dichaeta, Strain CCMP1751" /LENGTH=52 /DNA_ID=CAMNT_0043967657 /DNA_START=327 /DNA_END=482 /DNA_ORIENTATION=+